MASYRAAGKEYQFWIAVFGMIASVLPLVSALQRIFKVGLAPILREALVYYRRIFYPVIDVIQYILSYLPFLDVYNLFWAGGMSLDTYKDLPDYPRASAISPRKADIAAWI